MKDTKLYNVIAFRPGGWALVTQKPVPRAAAVQTVATEWASSRKARAVLHTNH